MLTASDTRILEVIEKGNAIQFEKLPPFNFPYPSLFRELSHEVILLSEFQKLLLIGAVERYSNICWVNGFSQLPGREERWGGFHPILDLKKLNRFVQKFWFWMLTLASIIPSLSSYGLVYNSQFKGCIFLSNQIVRSTLCFVMTQRSFQYKDLLFYLSTALRLYRVPFCSSSSTFKKTEYLCLPIFGWLAANVIFTGGSPISYQIYNIPSYGFGTVSECQKSNLYLTERIQWKGCMLDSLAGRVFLWEQTFFWR